MKIGVTGGTGLIGQCLIKNYGKVHTFIVVTSMHVEDIKREYIQNEYNWEF